MTTSEPHTDLDDSPYLSLTEVGEDARWAFGGGFEDPLEGMDTGVPDGVDATALGAACLALGDESLLTAQTLQRWSTHAPELEEEVGIANIALDLIGQTRLLYARAAAADPGLVPELPEGSPVPAEDRLAYFRDAEDFRVPTLAVMPDADFAGLVLRLAALAGWRRELWRELRDAPDPVLAAIAERAGVEVAYHRDLAERWVRVLAGGTEESARRIGEALAVVAPRVPELAATAVDDPEWQQRWSTAYDGFAAWWRELVSPLGEPVAAPPADPAAWRADLVQELQSVARRHPEATW